jgi:hypothetical protein
MISKEEIEAYARRLFETTPDQMPQHSRALLGHLSPHDVEAVLDYALSTLRQELREMIIPPCLH